MKHLAALLLLVAPLWVYAQCSQCTPDPTCTSPDNFPAICPENLPNGTAGVFYEDVMTFYMPGSVTDPGSGIEATLNQITVASVSGLPFGMTWQTNSPNNTYFPSQGENLGCATMCGTPILAGEYEVVIAVNVEVTAFGFNQSLNESFILSLVIDPGSGGNATFSYDAITGCGQLNSNFEALIDGAPGITTYAWDFGNGNISSSQTPPTQVYSEPGNYTVSLTTTIESFNIASVEVFQLNNEWCGDIEEPTCTCGVPLINFCPDPYFTITDGNGGVVYASSVVQDVDAAAWNNVNFAVTNPPYTITIWDADAGPPFGSADDNLGSAPFTLTPGVQAFNANGNIGTITLSLVVTNIFTNEEPISVFPVPQPLLNYDDENELISVTEVPNGIYIWTLNGVTVQEGAETSLVVTGPGAYQCTVINEFGCPGTTPVFTLCPNPEVVFNFATQTISVEAGFTSYAWTYNGLPIPGANNNVIDASASGNYAVTITTDYGCTVTSEVFQLDLNIDETTRITSISVWPNPAFDLLNVEVPDGRWTLEVFDLGGRLIQRSETIIGGVILPLPIAHLERGTYLLVLRSQAAIKQARFQVTR